MKYNVHLLITSFTLLMHLFAQGGCIYYNFTLKQLSHQELIFWHHWSHMRNYSSHISKLVVTPGIFLLASLLHWCTTSTCRYQVHLLQHPSEQYKCPATPASPSAAVSNWTIQGWIHANNKSICCSIHLVKRVDYVQTTSPSVAASIYSKGLTTCKQHVPLL